MAIIRKGQLARLPESKASFKVVDAGVPILDYLTGDGSEASYKRQPAVHTVVDFVARQVASIPLHVYRRVSDNHRERVNDGLLAQLLSRPSSSPGMTPYRFHYGLISDGLLSDRWLAVLEVDQQKQLSLKRIPFRRFSFQNDGWDGISAVRVSGPNGESETFTDLSSFLLDVGYSSRGVNGSSPLLALKEILDEWEESVRYRRNVLKNGARVPSVLKHPTTFKSDEAFQRFKSDWRRFLRGGAEEGGTPILEEGITLEKFDAHKPLDVDDLRSRELTKIEVASAYQIPPELIGAREGNFSNIDAFRQMLFQVTLGPYISAWEQTMNALVDIVQPGEDLYIEANVDSKLRGTLETQAKTYSTASGRPWLTTNEVRSRSNLPPIDGGDELVTPLNVLLGAQPSPQDGGNAQGANDVVKAFAARLEPILAAKRGAGQPFDSDRWSRELTADLELKAGLDSESANLMALLFCERAQAAYERTEQ